MVLTNDIEHITLAIQYNVFNKSIGYVRIYRNSKYFIVETFFT